MASTGKDSFGVLSTPLSVGGKMSSLMLKSDNPIQSKSKTHDKLLLLNSLLSCLLLLGCGGQAGSGPAPGSGAGGTSEIDRQQARLKLERMKAGRAQEQARQQEQDRLAAQKAEEEAAARERAAQEAAKPHYDPTRLNIAKNWRQWADITVPDLNIHAWLKTNWQNGKMHMRLALLGDKTALRLFTGNWPYFRLVFANQSGVNLHQCVLATSDLHWADSLRNSGTPTMEFESDDEVSLEVYESIVQWNLLWTDSVD